MYSTLYKKAKAALGSTQAQYELAVSAAASGDKLPADIDRILDGRTMRDFEADVKRLIARREAAETLASIGDLKADAAAAQAAVRAARQKLEEHPLAVMSREVEQLQRNLADAQAAASTASGLASSRAAQARGVLFSTAAKSVFKATADVENAINALRNNIADVALTPAERTEREAAERIVVAVPSKDLTITEAAVHAARLAKAKSTLKNFAERQREVARLEREVARLESQKDQAGEARMDPEAMEFASKPPAEIL